MWEGALGAFPVGTQEIILPQRDWINWEFGISVHITINVYNLDNQQDLLCSTGDYIQYSIGAWTGLKNNSALGKNIGDRAGRLADELNMRGKKEWRELSVDGSGIYEAVGCFCVQLAALFGDRQIGEILDI